MLERSNGRTPGVQAVTGPPSLVQLLYTESTGTVRDRFEGIVQIRTAGVRKCRSLHIVYHGLVIIREQSKGRTPGVQVAMGPLSLVQFVYTQPDRIAGARISGAEQTRRVCVQIPFTADCSTRPNELP